MDHHRSFDRAAATGGPVERRVVGDAPNGRRPVAPIRVLLVDDDEDDFVITRRLLQEGGNGGIELEWVADVDGARQVIAERRHDVYLLDYALGPVTGVQLMREALANGGLAPMIILTGQGAADHDMEALSAGAAEYLVKGECSGPLLARTIRYALEKTRSLVALQQSEERYALAVEGASDGLWDWDLDAKVIYLSPRWKRMLGYDPDEIGRSVHEWFGRVHPEDRARVQSEMSAHLSGETPQFESEHRLQTRQGVYRWVYARGLAVRRANGAPYRIAGSLTDIHARKIAEEQIIRGSMHDALTGLPNRVLLKDRLLQQLRYAERHEGYLFAILFVDLDCFKLVNDSLGHMRADQLLVAAGQRVQNNLRPGDTVARFGGDEFVILVTDIADEEAAVMVAERIQADFMRPFSIDGEEVLTTMSVGIVVHGSGRATPDEILRDADTAMYMAKQRGGAGYVVFGAEMGSNASVQLQLRADLRRAVAAQSLALRYQPILRLSDGYIAGFEALLRWEHPERGAVDPMEFIPAAESTGLIVPLGRWALMQACRTAAAWQTDGAAAVPISVNLSARQLQRSDFLSSLEAVLRETGLPASALVLELTETALFAHSEPVVRALEGIRALGISLHIDDFGTGYSSLNYLARLPVTALKVDRSFVQGLGRDEGSRKIIRGVVTLAHSLGIEVIAEGIESAAQLRLLRDEMGCDFGQGYLYARALESDEAFSCLVRQPWQRIAQTAS
ncbi:MAG TPA: EAL domain-containing protein [bacterium]|nr:EAL domain-containing protein [bacterium]